MIKFFFIILIIFSSCSLEKKSLFKGKDIADNKEIDLKEIKNKEIIKEDFNKNIKINLSKKIKNNKKKLNHLNLYLIFFVLEFLYLYWDFLKSLFD